MMTSAKCRPRNGAGRTRLTISTDQKPWSSLQHIHNTIGNPSYIMAVDITSKDGAFEQGVPHRLFQVTLTRGGRHWVRTPDGKKFLVILPPEQKPSNSFAVILNWPSLLKK